MASLAADHPVEICPGCLLGGALLDQEDEEDSRQAAVPPVVLRSARRCGDYELLEQVGRGGMGVVYRARRASLNKDFALKMLVHADTATAEELERLHIEAETAASIRHPNIVPVFEFGESEGRHYIAMEYIEGQNLSQKIAAKKFEMPRVRDSQTRVRAREVQLEIVRIMVAVTRAVEHAHACRFLHRDIKPSNILFDAKGQPFLSDFGLAKALDGSKSISKSGAILGTINYMSPEQADGKRVGFPSDVFSLGAVLYELLTGRQPFRGDSIGETLTRLQETDPDHPSSVCQWIDTDLATICLKCLEKDPQRRYASAGDLAADLDCWLANKPVKARPVRFFGRVKRWCKREPKIAGMAAGLFVLVMIVAVLTSILYAQSKQYALDLQRQYDDGWRALMERIEPYRITGNPIPVYCREIPIITHNQLLSVGSKQVLTLGARATDRISDRMVPPFAHFVQCLQTNLMQQFELPIQFGLILYLNEASSQMGVIDDDAQMYRLDPAVYVLARRTVPELVVLAREVHLGQTSFHGAIITHPESGINKLEDAKGSFAFGNEGSALEWLLPRATLAAKGVRQHDFIQITNNVGTTRVLYMVDKRKIAAGVIRQEDMVPGFSYKTLDSFECSTPVWVASSQLSTNMIAALRDSLLSLKDTDVLMQLDSRLRGFVPAHADDFNDLESKIEASKLFDAP